MSGPPPDYVDVNERIIEFRDKHPDGSLQSEIMPSPIEGFVVVKAYAFRTPDDPRPGTGLAWEPVPGKTNFTRDSELMNCETSAWGRAIIAVGAADAKRGIASANEVRNRQTDQPDTPAESNPAAATEKQVGAIKSLGKKLSDTHKTQAYAHLAELGGVDSLTKRQASDLLDWMSSALDGKQVGSPADHAGGGR